MALYTFHLFAGGGGGILADMLLGHIPIGAVEIEDYPRRILLSRQLDGILPYFPIWDDVRTFRRDNPETAPYICEMQKIRKKLCISGGFPCQDISIAGKGAGIAGRKSGLWREFARIIGEIRPKYVFVENVPPIIRRGLDVILTDFATMGYDAQWGVISAADAGAFHKRERFWLLADDHLLGCQSSESAEIAPLEIQQPLIGSRESAKYSNSNKIRQLQPQRCLPNERNGIGNLCQDVSHSYGSGQQEQRFAEPAKPEHNGTLCNGGQISQPGVGRMVDGMADWMDEIATGTWFDAEEHGLNRTCDKIPNRTNRLKSLGNGQVPLQAAVAWKMLLERLGGMKVTKKDAED